MNDELTKEEIKTLLLSLLGSLTLCDHMGDAIDDVSKVLKELGVEVEGYPDDYMRAVAAALHTMGVKTLYGTPLVSDEDEGE